MKVEVKRDATLTVTAGQIIAVSAEQAALAVKLGLVEPVKEDTKKKKAAK